MNKSFIKDLLSMVLILVICLLALILYLKYSDNTFNSNSNLVSNFEQQLTSNQAE